MSLGGVGHVELIEGFFRLTGSNMHILEFYELLLILFVKSQFVLIEVPLMCVLSTLA